MKTTIQRMLLLFIFSAAVNFSFSQNIKKAYKELFEKRNYSYAENIFNSDEYINTSQGRFGIAYIYYAKTYRFQDDLSYNENICEKLHKKVFAYYNILKAEDLFPEVSEKEKNKLTEYFSDQKVNVLKESLEGYFHGMERKDFIIVYDSLRKVCIGNEFYITIENKYIIDEFKYITKYRTNPEKVAKLIEKFPHNKTVEKLQRWVDSVRYEDAGSLKKCAFLLNDYPDNQFREAVIQKIKKINKKYQVKDLLTKHYILVINEAGTEEEAIKLLTERYYSYTSMKKYEVPPSFYYTELSDADAQRYNLKKKFLVYLYVKSINKDKVLKFIDKYKSYYENCYVLDPFYDVQIFSKDKVYKKGKLLDRYSAIVILPIGEYRISITEHSSTNPMRKVFETLRTKTKYHIIAWHEGYYKIGLHIEDNPFPVEYDLLNCSGFDPEKETINIIFVSSYKTCHHFEIAPDNIDEAVEIIMKKAKLYFKEP